MKCEKCGHEPTKSPDARAAAVRAAAAQIKTVGFYVTRSGRKITRLGRPPKYSAAAQRRARELYGRGLGAGAIALALAREGHGQVHRRTVRGWTGGAR